MPDGVESMQSPFTAFRATAPAHHPPPPIMVVNPMSGPSIVIGATFTADAIEPTLAFWMRELGFQYHIQIAPYNQVFQLLLDPAGALATNRGGVDIVLVRFEDWAHDLPQLARIRATLRDRMKSSPIMDGAQFARGVEDAYRLMWRRWCSTAHSQL